MPARTPPGGCGHAAASRWHGLDPAEARRRLARGGPNELPKAPRRTLPRIVLGVLAEPMFLLLVLAAGVYLALGDLESGALLAAFALLTIGMVTVQQARSERALEALRALAAPLARVLRGGQEQSIPAREVVVGDVLLLGEGERVAADAVLRRAEGLNADESLLTGESVPVAKFAHRTVPAGDDEPVDRVHAGTLVVAGHAVAEVTATGVATRAGRIGLSLATIETAPTPLQQSVARLVRLFGAIALVASAGVVVLYAARTGAWVEGLLSGIAVAMSLLPEEFPMALAVFLGLGAWRLAQLKVLARRPVAVETLGATSLLCVDKTGTLTENRMRVRALAGEGVVRRVDGMQGPSLDPPLQALLATAVQASKRRAVDPMDRALYELAATTLEDGVPGEDWTLEREYGLSSRLPAVTRVWRAPDGARHVAVKGAPEAVAGLCRLEAARQQQVRDTVEKLATDGLRVLGVAGGGPGDAALPDEPAGFALQWRGLVGFVDPLRPRAAEAVRAAREAGIDVAMVTGDHPVTALAIAREAGIDTAGGTLSGAELEAMDDAALVAAARSVRVFARVPPEQKLRLVQAMRDAGEVVAMTGDGVNDAPALRAAHIGLAMGRRGTDVARQSAAIVLMDDDIGNLIAGIHQGRRIFANLRKTLVYITAIHVPIAGLALLPLLAGWPPLLLPMHVVLVELVVDPVCSIAFESEPADPDSMQRPPRDPNQPLAGLPQLSLALLQGALLLAACLGAYALALEHYDEAAARTLAFVALTAGNLMLVRVNSSPGATLPRLAEPGHRAYWIVASAATAIVAACMAVPALAALFRFGAAPPMALAAAAAAGALGALAFDLLKPLPAVRRVLSPAPVRRPRRAGARG